MKSRRRLSSSLVRCPQMQNSISKENIHILPKYAETCVKTTILFYVYTILHQKVVMKICVSCWTQVFIELIGNNVDDDKREREKVSRARLLKSLGRISTFFSLKKSAHNLASSRACVMTYVHSPALLSSSQFISECGSSITKLSHMYSIRRQSITSIYSKKTETKWHSTLCSIELLTGLMLNMRQIKSI